MTADGFDQSLDGTFDSIGEELKMWVRARFNEIVDQITGHPESPIEEALLAAMVALNTFKPFFEFQGSETPIPRVGHAYIRVQHRIGPYRADFLAEARLADRFVGAVVIECDGKNWHKDKAKDAARDAYMMERGYTILRLKGSDIYANPVKAALEVVQACEKLFDNPVGRGGDKPVNGEVSGIDPQALTAYPPEIHNENRWRLQREEGGVTPDTHNTSSKNNP